VLALLLTLLGAASASAPGGTVVGGWSAWLIGAGLFASCGLAIAAGFCSLAPPAAWLVLACLGFGAIEAAPGGAHNRWILLICAAAAGVMIAVQLWRIRTGRFAPTIT
jgi:hypothetical protein